MADSFNNPDSFTRSSFVSRLERDLASEAKMVGRVSGWPIGEIAHTSPVVWYGPRNLPFDYVFGEMLRKDSDLAGFHFRTKMGVLALPREVEKADQSVAATEAVEVCEKQIEILSSGSGLDFVGGNQWLMMLYSLLDKDWQGTAFVEANWNPETFFIEEVVEIPMHRFGFVETPSGGAELRVRRAGRLEPIPRGKIIFARNSLHGFPWGDPLANYLWGGWKAKIYNWLSWALFLERWASNITDVKYKSKPQTGLKDFDNSSNPEEDARHAKALTVAQNIRANGYAVHNDQIDVDLINKNVSGGEQFLQYHTAMASAQARMMLNETRTSGLSSLGGYNEVMVSKNLGADRQKFFAPSLSQLVESTIFRWTVETHTPGAPIPHYRVHSVSAESYDRLLKGILLGLKTIGVGEKHLRLILGVPEASPGELLVKLAEGGLSSVSVDQLDDVLNKN